ncbi:hypothetical protein CTEN210_02923 [Chaetoceros tenuissimus]|uniref:BTB domain-containing protein n=1 Tax=Chaetoceros tenuissimus TaxID=426638 RepID=A0AAD3CJV8_9STRA|nr:hypothetical protein CTEN210_02923 [Chaetoceros tenuissimus]
MQNTTDPIIGIDARGKVFYTHLSTLVNSSSEGSYFDRRFNSDLPPGACRKDDIGRDVYFVDRSAELFEHILNYLTEGRRSWPTYQADSVLWERLYREAQFYGLDDLCSMLQTTHDCPYNPHLSTRAKCKGILYWLGTKMTGSYQNPADTGLVEAEVNCSGYEPDISQNKSEAIANFFQYRPLVNEKDGETNCVSTGFDILFLQAGEEESQDVKIKFPSISIKPTHISLRCNSYINLTYFKFEASKDGLTWIPLLKVKPDVKEESSSRTMMI